MTKSGPPQSPLRALAVKSAAWYGATRLWGQLISWAVTILLARLLVPNDYGLFAIALSVLALLELLQEFGLGTAIVQRQDLTRQQLNALFWVVTTTSFVLATGTFLAAEGIGRLYAEPGLVWILRVLCLTFLLNSVGMVPYSLLTKAIDLRRRSLAEAMGTGASALLALALAYLGYGVWALVLGQLARSVVLNTALIISARWRPGLQLTRDGLGGLLNFGVRVAGTQIIGNFSSPIATFILARFLGGAAVGLFAMAQALAEAPHRFSTGIINQISLPVFAKLQNEREVLGAYYLKISKYIGLVALPLQVGLILVAPDLVPALLSAKWQDMVMPFQIFCLESAIVMLTLTASPLLTARGRADLLLRMSFVVFVGMTLATAVGAQFSLAVVMIARLVANCGLRLMLLIPSLREIDVPVTAYLGTLVSPLAASAVMVAAVLAARDMLAWQAGHVERLVLGVIIGALVYPAALLIFDRSLGAEVRIVARDLFSPSKV